MADTPTPRRRSRSRSKGRYSSENKPIRVWCPGSYDFLHYTQINFLQKVKQTMSLRFPKVELVVGLYADQVLISKGRRPVFSLNERYDMVKANKWVDDIVKDAPLELSKNVLKEYSCDYAFCMEKNDDTVNTPEYDDLREELMESGLLKTLDTSSCHVPSFSSSDLINRMLLKEPKDDNNNTLSGQTWKPERLSLPYSISCKEMLSLSSKKIPRSTDKVVYVGGAFDLLHPGHLNILEKAQSLGDFLYVGLHSDQTVSKYAGDDYPVLKWNERLLSLLACKYVSEVIIDAPAEITESLLKEFSINCVVRGIDDYGSYAATDAKDSLDRYAVAKRRGILVEMTPEKQSDDNENSRGSSDKLKTEDILKRVHQNWQLYNYVID